MCKIGLSMNDINLNKSIFSNGLRQNAYFIYTALKELGYKPFWIINDKIISDSPDAKVVCTEPIPMLVNSESNRFTVTSVAIDLVEDKFTLMNPISPDCNVDVLPC